MDRGVSVTVDEDGDVKIVVEHGHGDATEMLLPPLQFAALGRQIRLTERHMEAPKCPACGTTDGIITKVICLNPWHAIKPKGCPTPGACSCPELCKEEPSQ